ncbi:hypothetical protein Tco_0702526 [Tanacetum coccineum]|uniref:Uncharacterized protein n=1 Tax=Tanacetum coccineum TaxID=301880 RepID=A0ABQ4XY16_9ASTR
MTTLAEHIIVAGAENRPPMLEKSMYDSWASRTCLFIKGKKNGRMMLNSIDNGPCLHVRSSNSVHWDPMFVLYCHRSVTEDYMLAKEITRVSGEVNNVVIAQAQFLEELDILETRNVPVKMDEFSMRFKGRTVR